MLIDSMSIPGLRSPYETVGGLVFFGRMIDKIRLQEAGTLPPGYNLGCQDRTWFDSRCTRFLGVDYGDLRKQVLAGMDDDALLQWCFAHGTRPTEDQIEIWNAFMTKRGWRDAGTASLRESKRNRGFSDRDDIETFFDFHVADENDHPAP